MPHACDSEERDRGGVSGGGSGGSIYDPLPTGRGDGGWLGAWLGPLGTNGTGGGGGTNGTGGVGDAPLVLERCCAQFLVSRSRVRRRPRAFYEVHRAFLALLPVLSC